MKFEYDPNKSESNKHKHGIDFEEAQRLWDGLVVKVPSPGDYGEERFVVFGMIDGKHWTAAITERAGVTRIISVRRSRQKEVLYYEQANQQ